MSARVAINGSFLVQQATGVQRYAQQLSRALRELPDRSFESVLLAPPGSPIAVAEALADRVVIDESALPLAVWVQCKLPYLSHEVGADLLWSPSNLGPWLSRRQVVTVHDASFCLDRPWFSRSFRRYYRFLVPRVAHRARRVLTVSEFSRRELAAHGIAPTSVIVANGIEDGFRPTAPCAEFAALAPYVIAIGAGNPRKNVATAVAAWRRVARDREDLRLLIVGRRQAIFGSNGASESAPHRSPTLDERIVELGHVADDAMPGLYSGAEVLLYPSFYEGFGLPPLEALACGVPAVVASTTSLPEVCGDAALYASPDDVDGFARQLQRLLDDPELRERLLAQGRERLAYYRWSRSAAELANVLSDELRALDSEREPTT